MGPLVGPQPHFVLRLAQKLAGTRDLAYIESMASIAAAPPSNHRFPALPGAGLLVWALALAAPLACLAGPPRLSATSTMEQGLSIGGLRVVPSLQGSPGGFWGPAASVETADGWFATASLGRLNPTLDKRPSYGFADTKTLSAGYRFSTANSLSLSLTSASGQDVAGSRVQRLGLSVRYDWPAYYVRLGLDPRLTTAPQDSTLRFSAGFRF